MFNTAIYMTIAFFTMMHASANSLVCAVVKSHDNYM